MTSNIASDLRQLLRCTFNKESNDIHFEIFNNSEIQQGMMGDIFPVLLTKKNNKVKVHIILKKQKTNNDKIVAVTVNVFENETFFYKTIWPKFRSLYEEGTRKTLDLVPHCLGMSKSLKNGAWLLALEDISIKGFKMLDPTRSFDESHFKTIYGAYGFFHGLSMIMKQKNETEFREVVETVLPTFRCTFESNGIFTKTIKGITRLIRSSFFDPNSEGYLIEKLVSFERGGLQLCYNILGEQKYEGVLLHGDCWSNNFMFKYNVSIYFLEIS